MVLLFSTDPDGICHIETSGLDGESNLKQRQVVRGYSEQVSNVFSVDDFFSFQMMTELIFTCIDKEIFEFIFTFTKWNFRELYPVPDISGGVL